MPKKTDRTGWKLLPDGQLQDGWLEESSGSTWGVFRTYWRLPDGTERERKEKVKLGLATMGKKKAQADLRAAIAKFYEEGLRPPSLPPKATPQSTFSAFADRFWSKRSGDWAPNTLDVNKMYFDVLKGRYGDRPIVECASEVFENDFRDWLGSLAREGKSKTYIQHLLIYARSALNLGVKDQVIHYNYLRDVKAPKGIKDVDESVLSAAEIAAIIKHLKEQGQHRDALILEMLYLDAFRPGELFGLRWNDWDPQHPERMRVDEAYGKHGLGNVKTKKSRGVVYLPPELQAELWEWRKWCGDARPEAFIFTSKQKTPIRYENFLKRVLRPAAEAVGVARITHQMLRRSFSTEALDNGASPKDVQGQMRHSQVSMSLAYGKVIPKSVAEEVNKMSANLAAMIDPTPAEPEPIGAREQDGQAVTEAEICPKDAPNAPKVYKDNLLEIDGGRDRTRTCDLLRVKQAL